MDPEHVLVLRSSQAEPHSTDGRQVFAGLFGPETAADAVELFDVTFPRQTRLGVHWHTGDLAACVTAGGVEFVFGDESVVLASGDYIRIRASVAHDERSADGVSMAVAHVGPFENVFP